MKNKDAIEWFEYLRDNAEEWEKRVKELDTKIKKIIFDFSETNLNNDAIVLSTYYCITYLNHYFQSITTDPSSAFPSEVITFVTDRAVTAAEVVLAPLSLVKKEEEVWDVDSIVTMKGGDA